MCGISGAIGFTHDFQKFKSDFQKGLTHRGPDMTNSWEDQGIFLNHNRLSIIDIEGGGQPMQSADGNHVLVFNGELYNYKELRNSLKNQGILFHTESDTEVVLESYIHWGSDCLNLFRGMFSFAIVDKRKNLIFLARDQFGIKPLVYHRSRYGFYFASEIQAFKKLPYLDFTLSPEALDEYFWFQYIPAPKTIFEEVKKLPPAHFMLVDFSGSVKELNRYWNFEFNPTQEVKSQTEWLEEVEETIKESVKAHLVADVPFGAFLSGGIDSSLVVSHMSEVMNKPVKTFSIGFDDEAYNEIKFARKVAKKYRTEHFEEIIKPDALAILPKLVSHYGEPFGDSSSLPTYYVSKLASNEVKMVLSGDGGDEGFLGYESYPKWINGLSYPGVSAIKRLLYPLGRKVYPQRYFNRKSYKYWIEINRYFPYEIRKNLFGTSRKSIPAFEHQLFEQLFSESRKAQHVQKAQYADMNTYLPSDILAKVDIASMANSLEVRTPLIDMKVWDLVSKIPPSVHMTSGNKPEGKVLLKKLLSQKMGDEFAFRKKQGFSVPLNSWFKNDKMALDRLRENSNLSQFLDKRALEDLVNEGFSHRIWLLLFLDEWLYQFNN